jgi:hypothetical protein
MEDLPSVTVILLTGSITNKKAARKADGLSQSKQK